MCVSKPKVKDVAPPPPTVINSDVEAGAVDSDVTQRQRKKKGFAFTRTDQINTILGALGGKSTLG